MTPYIWSRKALALVAICLLTIFPRTTACPGNCYCFDTFVTCSNFTSLDLAALPSATDTLILTGGLLEEIPSGFLAKATYLRMLELNSVNARVIKSGAFSGILKLDLLSITSSTFDIVESKSFAGLTNVNKFHISDSKFNKVDKHAFVNMNNVIDFRIWSSSFDMISDEAFYKISEISSFQLYQNNITSLGSKLFLESADIDTISIYKNKILNVSNDCLMDIHDVTSRMILHANIFICSCDIVWVLSNQVFMEYLASNECIFPDHTGQEITKFRIADVTREALCPGGFSEEYRDITTEVSEELSTRVASAKDLLISTNDLLLSTLSYSPDIDSTSPRRNHVTSSVVSIASSTSDTQTVTESTSEESSSTMSTSEESSSTMSTSAYKSTAPLFHETSSSQIHIKSSTDEVSLESSQKNVFEIFSTDSQSHEETTTQYPDHFTTNPQKPAHTKDSLMNTPAFTGEIIREGWTAPIPQASIDVDKNEHVRSHSTGPNDMSTIPPNNLSITLVNWGFIAFLSGLTLLLCAP